MKAHIRIPVIAWTQRGIVLPLTLILLVILSLLGIMAMRNATVGSQTMNGVRSYTMAEMAAEAGLRYCEEIVKEQASPSSPAKYTAEIGKIATLARSGRYCHPRPCTSPLCANGTLPARTSTGRWSGGCRWAGVSWNYSR